ncbi:hypothetical protein [Acinetobacter bereziniae]|uniref:hypothetical protein n=1 Tax=Acinetobacter bereziniae TaxID=106648 RepID=UPI0030082122
MNKYYEKNMTISKSEGERPPEINNIQKHLGKADFVPVDFRVLNEANQKIFLNYVKTLPRYQQEKFIIIKE